MGICHTGEKGSVGVGDIPDREIARKNRCAQRTESFSGYVGKRDRN